MIYTKQEILDAYYKYCTSIWPDDVLLDDTDHFCKDCSLKLYCEKNEILRNASDEDFEWLESFLIKHNYLDKKEHKMDKDKIELMFAFQTWNCSLDCENCPFQRVCNLDFTNWKEEDFKELRKLIHDNYITVYSYDNIPQKYIDCVNEGDYWLALDIASNWSREFWDIKGIIEETDKVLDPSTDVKKEDKKIETGVYESVNAPAHYAGTDCIEKMEKIFGTEAVKHFCILNAYKYLYRAGKKPGVDAEQDRAKADWYLDYAGKLVKKDDVEFF